LQKSNKICIITRKAYANLKKRLFRIAFLPTTTNLPQPAETSSLIRTSDFVIEVPLKKENHFAGVGKMVLDNL